MDTIVSLLFESPATLAALCAVVCLVLLVLWRRTGSAGRRKAFLGAVAVSVVLLVLQAVIQTDRERIVGLVQALAEAAERADVERIEESIDADYRDGRLDRAGRLAWIRDQFTHRVIRDAGLSAFDVAVSGNEATASFRVACTVRDHDTAYSGIQSRWEVALVRRGNEWMVHSIRPVQIGPFKASETGGVVGW